MPLSRVPFVLSSMGQKRVYKLTEPKRIDLCAGFDRFSAGSGIKLFDC